MAHKELKYDAAARKALEAGVDAVANAVKVTLGPKGRYVVLDKKFGAPTITNDGVTIAREIELEDPYENLGAQLAKNVATKTNDVAHVHVERDAVAVVVDAAGAHGDDRALLRLLLGGVRDDQTGSRGLLRFERANHDPVL